VFVGSVGSAAVAQRIGAVLTRGTSVIELARPAAQLGERVSALPPIATRLRALPRVRVGSRTDARFTFGNRFTNTEFWAGVAPRN
jgi:hypothetical protein